MGASMGGDEGSIQVKSNDILAMISPEGEVVSLAKVSLSFYDAFFIYVIL